MRYLILVPSDKPTLDPRGLACGNDAEFYGHMGAVEEYTMELAAMYAVRRRYPDAVVMPVPVKVGSGAVFVLGVLPSIHVHARIDPQHQDVPFVMFVRACADNADERRRIQKSGGAIYTELHWRVPTTPVLGTGYALEGEFRSQNLKNPIPARIMVAPVEGDPRVALHGEVMGERFAVLVNLRELGTLVDCIREDVRVKSDDAARATSQEITGANVDAQRHPPGCDCADCSQRHPPGCDCADCSHYRAHPVGCGCNACCIRLGELE